LIGHVYSTGTHRVEVITVISQDVSEDPTALTYGNQAYEFCQSIGVTWHHSSRGAVLQNVPLESERNYVHRDFNIKPKQDYVHKDPVIFHAKLQRESHNTYGTATSVTRLQLVAPPSGLQQHTDLHTHMSSRTLRLGSVTLL